MGFDDSDIIPIPSHHGVKFSSILPFDSNEFLYMKIMKNGKIISTSGDYIKNIFKLNKSKLKYRNLSTIKYDFFRSFIHDIIIRNPIDNIQFTFTYRDHITPYSCSLYPCLVSGNPDSYDVVIRENKEYEAPYRYHTIL